MRNVKVGSANFVVLHTVHTFLNWTLTTLKVGFVMTVDCTAVRHANLFSVGI